MKLKFIKNISANHESTEPAKKPRRMQPALRYALEKFELDNDTEAFLMTLQKIAEEQKSPNDANQTNQIEKIIFKLITLKSIH